MDNLVDIVTSNHPKPNDRQVYAIEKIKYNLNQILQNVSSFCEFKEDFLFRTHLKGELVDMLNLPVYNY